MSMCAVKRGIITLRDCGQTATGSCSACARPICQEHTKISSGTVLCVECYARREEQALADAAKGSKANKGAAAPNTAQRRTANDEPWEDPTWPYSYRHHYYTTSYYNPFYSGDYYDSYYDDYDLRSFQDPVADTFQDEDGGVGGFYDS